MSLRDQYKRAKRPPKVVPIEGLGDVRIRSMTMGELKRMLAEPDDVARALLILSAVVDEAGQPVFTDQADLDEMDSAILLDLVNAIVTTNNPPTGEAKNG